MAKRFAERLCANAAPASDSAELETRLTTIVEAGRKVWPKIAIADEAFIDHLAMFARAAPDRDAYLGAVHAGDLFLACGVCLHDRAALAAFEEHFMSQVRDFVLRVRMSNDAVDEIKQKLRERLVLGSEGAAPKIAEYSGKGALGGWLRITAVRTALNHLRDTGAAAKTEELGDELAPGADPELAYVKEHASDLFSDAFKRVLDGLAPNERSMLRLHYIDGLTLDQLAQIYKTPRSTLARRVAATRQQILEATESLLRDEQRLSPSAVASVIRQAQSQMQLTITRHLR
jgi:RNA polymerase sigma-70 factor (ECF subfamily)